MYCIEDVYVQAAKSLVAAQKPPESVWLQAPELAENWAREFINHFPGEIGRLAYAVKANPDPQIIGVVHGVGVKNFEIASLEEAALVRSALFQQSDYALWFHNPLCSDRQIEIAFTDYSARNFVVTSEDALKRLHGIFSKYDVPPEQIHLAIRIKVGAGSHASDGAYDHLFAPDYTLATHAAPLLLAVARSGYRHSLYFNISTQTSDPQLYADALSDVSTTIKLAEAKGLRPNLEHINIGAGLPSPEGNGQSWNGYTPFFDVVRLFRLRNADGRIVPFAAEPGRALVAPSEALLVPINHVDEANNRLVLSQSLAGGLHHLAKLPEVAPMVHAIAGDDRKWGGQKHAWRVTGGSPAGFEVTYPRNLDLPSSVRAGDYLLILMQGAYGRALTSSFNGMSPPHMADVRLAQDGAISVSPIRRLDGAVLPSQPAVRSILPKTLSAEPT